MMAKVFNPNLISCPFRFILDGERMIFSRSKCPDLVKLLHLETNCVVIIF